MTDAHDDRLITDLAATLDPEEVRAYAEFAIRTRSPLAREVLRAAGESAALGRVATLSGNAGGHQRGLAALDEVVAGSGVTSLPVDVLTIWADLLLRSGRDTELQAVLEDPDVALTDADRWKLRTDLLNPYRMTSHAEDCTVLTGEEFESVERQWLQVFNEVYRADGLEPIRLRPAAAGGRPYQRLEAPVADRLDGDLVTVVMSAYQPDRDLLLAVRGVIAQTWHNLELIVVDDASTPGSEDVLEEAEALDPRVRVVRAPRNRGTYEARNLALSIAQGRWMTFQDSDDWTHPRRVEHQVRHLQESPTVLANRTRTLRAYSDLTMTFVGYPAERLNASSLLFDRIQVTKLVGAFDSTRKTADMELPERLEAIRPGSVRDLRHPAPLAIVQLRADSLSRNDAVPGWMRWDRLAYRHSYQEWHQQLAARRLSPALPAPTGRPFPLPRNSWQPDRDTAIKTPSWDVVVLGDLRPTRHDSRRAMGVARTAANAGLRTAVAHAESPRPLTRRRSALLPELSTDTRLGRLGQTDIHEDDECELLIVTEPASVLHVDAAGLRVQRVLVVVDDRAPEGWSVAAVDRRCEELFGMAPIWGGPTRIHDQPDGRSAVRLAVPDERWCRNDLAVVAGVGRFLVGTPTASRPIDRRRMGTPIRPFLVVGHHLDDDPRRWLSSPDDMRAAYPEQLICPDPAVDGASTSVPVELHCLRQVRTPSKVLGHRMRPPSWVSYAGTGMTVPEFLSHIDVWVYFGQWDTTAEVAALEALDAGLPCVLGEDATVSDLHGPVRCVAPGRAREAMEELLALPAARARTPRERHEEWTRTLRRFVAATEGPPAPRSAPAV